MGGGIIAGSGEWEIVRERTARGGEGGGPQQWKGIEKERTARVAECSAPRQ